MLIPRWTAHTLSLPPGTYAAAETVPAGWTQTGTTYSNGSPVGSIALSSGETVTCTFTDTDVTVTAVALGGFSATSGRRVPAVPFVGAGVVGLAFVFSRRRN